SYQKFVIHHIEIIRDGKRINKLEADKIKLLQRETQLEGNVYNGVVSVSVVLDDVRVGDVLDVAYTIKGANPVFKGKFMDSGWAGSIRGPVAFYQYRLVAPANRKLYYKSDGKAIKVEHNKLKTGEQEYVFKRESAALLHVDANAPYSAAFDDMIIFSEYKDWAEIAEWGTALFAERDEKSPAVEKKAKEIMTRFATPEERVLAALDFVQKDVRYFGNEFGEGTHQPNQPENVIQQRFGDCKDKVFLLVSLLKRMNIAASPVLVSTYLGPETDRMLPTAFAFNHVIAKVELNGVTYWLDATRANQTGSLANRQIRGFGKGLVVEKGTKNLTDMPSWLNQLQGQVVDTFTVNKFAEGALLDSRITYYGDLAESVRASMATRSAAEVETQFKEPYVRTYPSLITSRPLRSENSTTENAITIIQQFKLPGLWSFPEEGPLVADVALWSLVDALRYPSQEQRRDPFVINYPGVFRHNVIFKYPENVYKQNNSQNLTDGDSAFVLKQTVDATLNMAEFDTEIRFLKDQVEPGEWAAHTAKLNQLTPRMRFTTTVPSIAVTDLPLLTQRVENLKREVMSGHSEYKTGFQVNTAARIISLTAQLDAGRLPDNLKAQALNRRGVAYDSLGQFGKARADLAAAVELAPDSLPYLADLASNALYAGDYKRAIETANKVLAKDPTDQEALETRSTANFFLKHYREATTDLDALMKTSSLQRRNYPLIWLFMAHKRAGNGADKAFAPYADMTLPDSWPRPIVDYMLGKRDIDSVLSMANTGKDAKPQLCEAYYYLGEWLLMNGDKRRALEFFQKSLDQGILEYREYPFAQMELENYR
ncbi:MAG TPA: DUF3857 domain-containing protein, partial [Pseudomonadales bacterium]|nr:DUF3857 domain-containing protein [Pseudomonadales bacterium]